MLKRGLTSWNDVWSAMQCVLWGVSYDGECPHSKRLSSALCMALLVPWLHLAASKRFMVHS